MSRKKFAEGVTVTDYVLAGSAPAALAGFAGEVSCACCGSRISHVFLSSVGPLGGDCAASLTGDHTTRSAVQRAVRAARPRASEIGEVTIERDGSSWGVSYVVRGSGRVRESDGEVIGARRSFVAGGIKGELRARIIADAVRAVAS